MRFRRLPCAVAVVLVAGCAGMDCNDVGCDTGVVVNSAAVFAIDALPLSVTVCADEVCQTHRIESGNVDPGQDFVPVYARVDLDDERERNVAVTFEVRSESTGAILADAGGTGHLQRLQPNGASCGPICYTAQLTYDDVGKTLA